MYTKSFVLSLFITLGISLPMFPVIRPYIPSGLGPVPSITTNAYIAARDVVVNAEGEIATGFIPEKWKHTHGTLFPETAAEKSCMERDCGEKAGGCASLIDDILDEVDEVKEEVKEHLPEELGDRGLGDGKEGVWSC